MNRYFADAAAKTLAVVRGDAVLLLPRAAWTRHEGLWESLGAIDPVAATLGVLAREGIADLADFALVVGRTPGRLRVVVRGGFRVRAADDIVTAAGVSTWHERTIDEAAGFEVLAPFATSGPDASALPIVEGVVPAVVVRRGAADVAAPPAAQVAEEAMDDEALPTPEAEEPISPEPEPVPVAEPQLAVEPEPARSPVPEVRPASGAEVPPVFEPGAVAPESAREPAPVPEHTLIPADDETILVAHGVPLGVSEPSDDAGAPVEGDHDGLTVAVTQIQRLRRARATGPLADSGVPEPEPVQAAPALRVLLPGGGEEPLTGEMVIGRSPSVSRASGGSLPRLVTIGVGDPDISRSHLRLALEGGTVVVTDLHSRNGTNVVQPGRPPVKLRAGEATPVLAGTVIDLGGGCTLQVVSG